uniref:Transmembrane protein n=1 Tax=Panagrolaimus superbus TaxID=310955 RepID=A0A914YLZ8_9BILA
MIVSQQRILFILVVFTLLSLSLQKEEEEECYKISTIHFKDDHCSQTPSSYEQLKTFSKLCGNIAYLGYHEKQEKYFFLTNEFNLIGFEDESNVWTKAIEHPDMKKYNFTIIKSQLLEKHLYLLALHNDFYYLIIVEISKGDKVINSSILKFGHKDMVFPNLECDNIYFIKVERGDTVYLNKGINFQQEKLKIYNQNITLLKQIKPSKFEVFTSMEEQKYLHAINVC